MREFFKFMFASMLGFILASLVVFVIFFAIVASLISFTKKETVIVPDKTILMLSLDTPVNDRAPESPFSTFNFNDMSASRQLGLDEILSTLKNAAKDDKVKGIYLDLSVIPAGIATVEEIRNGLLEFKKSGKFIVSYSETYTQKSYYLASVADKICLNPAGSMEFKGISGEVVFFKGMLDKLDIEAQVIRHGKFKSAVEPFLLDKMSEASKVQTLSYVTAIWDQVLKGISESRKISREQLTQIADKLMVHTPQDAVDLKLVDKLMYKDELIEELKTRVGISDANDLKIMKFGKYADAPSKNDSPASSGKIAVIFATGNIVSGEGDDNSIGSERISKAIRKARLDESVKAIVLRVNSPGGSALASDVIWREVVLAKKAKPVVASMGDVAASGGYYISCAANKIYASPNTITGSIGVFGIVPNMQQFFNQKLGITFDGVKTNTYADYIPVTRPMSAEEKGFLTRDIENIYTTFITHVSEGRKMPVASIDSIGQGRVWSGTDAKKIGLIDEFGGLPDAVKEAAKLANLKNYRLMELPVQKDPFTQIFEALSGDNTSILLKKELGPSYGIYQYLKNMSQLNGVQALMPYDIEVR
ncbi:MAG: signal peptide peptidase SppA [Bacteroidetes bacterium]|nr:signal peptide peptidase SppA [Bacteroidota bacterium]